MQPVESEEALMEAYVGGDAGAFQRLFRRLAPSLHGFFARTAGAFEPRRRRISTDSLLRIRLTAALLGLISSFWR